MVAEGGAVEGVAVTTKEGGAVAAAKDGTVVEEDGRWSLASAGWRATASGGDARSKARGGSCRGSNKRPTANLDGSVTTPITVKRCRVLLHHPTAKRTSLL